MNTASGGMDTLPIVKLMTAVMIKKTNNRIIIVDHLRIFRPRIDLPKMKFDFVVRKHHQEK